VTILQKIMRVYIKWAFIEKILLHGDG